MQSCDSSVPLPAQPFASVGYSHTAPPGTHHEMRWFFATTGVLRRRTTFGLEPRLTFSPKEQSPMVWRTCGSAPVLISVERFSVGKIQIFLQCVQAHCFKYHKRVIRSPTFRGSKKPLHFVMCSLRERRRVHNTERPKRITSKRQRIASWKNPSFQLSE